MGRCLHRVLACFFAVALSACDTFYGPSLTNAFGTTVEVTIVRSNGQVVRTEWPPCRTAFIGEANAQVTKVLFTKNNEVLREFSSEEIDAMVRTENANDGYSEWVVGPSGTLFGTNRSAGPCSTKK